MSELTGRIEKLWQGEPQAAPRSRRLDLGRVDAVVCGVSAKLWAGVCAQIRNQV
jgi:hypothetical protein